jgi:hypothetical protein
VAWKKPICIFNALYIVFQDFFTFLWVLMCKLLFVTTFTYVLCLYYCETEKNRIEKFFTLHNHKRINARSKNIKFPFAYKRKHKLTLFLNQSLRITSKQHLRNSFFMKTFIFVFIFWFFFMKERKK